MISLRYLKAQCSLFSTLNRYTVSRCYSNEKITLFNISYDKDDWTNLNKNIQEKLGRNLLHTRYHPLYHLKNKIKHFFYQTYIKHSSTPLFSVFDNFSPVVSVEQNFDSLLTPADHVSRSKKDCFYVNKNYLLRAHTTAHSSEMIRSGLDAFLTFGDVYRRDEIDSKHYPVFHQCDGVRLFTETDDLFNVLEVGCFEILIWMLKYILMLEEFVKERKIFTRDTNGKKVYTEKAIKLVEEDMKDCLTSLAQFIFSSSSELKMRWNKDTFPFTHPSWELEVEYKGVWYEILGCGVFHKEILENAGADHHIAWAFGLGLERWSMILNDIPDIRIFWSTDSGFLSQFKYEDPHFVKNATYKPISVYPQCMNDISFWLPVDYSANDFYDLVRDVGGDLVEQVQLIDQFTNKSNKTSHCYRIVYRSMERTLSQQEVNQLHKKIENLAMEKLNVKIR